MMETYEIHLWYFVHIAFLALTAFILFGDLVWRGEYGGVANVSFFFLGASFVAWLFRITYLKGQRSR
jgi:hypothetical protein